MRESKTVLDSGFHAIDSGFQVLKPVFVSLVSGTWILDSRFQSLVAISAFCELYSELRIPNSGFRILRAKFSWIPDSTGKFLGFPNPDSLTWGEMTVLMTVALKGV